SPGLDTGSLTLARLDQLGGLDQRWKDAERRLENAHQLLNADLGGTVAHPAARRRTILPGSSRAAVGATIAGGVVTGLASAPERLSRLFRRRFPTVAVTGMTGVGKTQLADRLAGRNPGDGVAEVGSAVMERRTRRSPRLHGFRFLVVPGDNAATRLAALDEVFHDEPVDGVIHVVANGYATPRRTAGTTGTATAAREEQLAAELEDWAITAHRIASMAVRRDKPIWLVIAVTKADLYADDLEDVVRYYSPGSGSPFGDKVDELRALAGGAKLSVDVLPVSSQGGDRSSAIPAKRAAAMVDALATRLAQLSGHV
ncbi:MAG: GTPase domain-containing protein, partial [Nocardioides sp.]|nr:GTPase domain-containing protein [Nocardioides sp.]